MKQILEKIKKTDFIIIFMMLMPFIFGTFYNFSVFVVAIILQIITLILYIKNKKLNIKINSALICSGALFGFSILSIIWAVDKNDAIIGTLRYLSIVVFNIFIMQCSEERKDKIFEIIPYSALLMLALSIIIGFIPSLKSYVYTPNGRIMGFFPYANTFALYLLIGIVIITNKNKGKWSILITIALTLGILLTGSRTTLILATFYIIYICFNKENKQRKYYAITYVGLVFLAIIYVLVSNKIESVGRIFSISPNTGTLLERILYWKDSLKLIISNPFGLRIYGLFI